MTEVQLDLFKWTLDQERSIRVNDGPDAFLRKTRRESDQQLLPDSDVEEAPEPERSPGGEAQVREREAQERQRSFLIAFSCSGRMPNRSCNPARMHLRPLGTGSSSCQVLITWLKRIYPIAVQPSPSYVGICSPPLHPPRSPLRARKPRQSELTESAPSSRR